MANEEQDFGQRDRATLQILGTFFLIMGGLVMLGVVSASDNFMAALVTALSAMALGGIGAGMLLAGWRVGHSARTREER